MSKYGWVQAKRRFPIAGKLCEVCERPAHDRHHRDGDSFNNVIENIAFLCRKCHMDVDGRNRVLRERMRKLNQDKGHQSDAAKALWRREGAL